MADAVDPVALTRSLVDIDSTTGREADVGVWLARFLSERGYTVTEQPVSNGRFNVYARLDAPPSIVLSTHFDCVPPFFPSREERGLLFGRGACDAKGILAAQVTAAERLRAAGETRIALLFVVGEERGSDGARARRRSLPDQRRTDRQPSRRGDARSPPRTPARKRTRGALVVPGTWRVGDRQAARCADGHSGRRAS